VSSWLGNGANLPISVDQLRQALGDDTIRQISQSLGIPIDQLLNQLSQHLPATVDKAQPERDAGATARSLIGSGEAFKNTAYYAP
jgi:uncharacterized protein YidB (DUF937 family)